MPGAEFGGAGYSLLSWKSRCWRFAQSDTGFLKLRRRLGSRKGASVVRLVTGGEVDTGGEGSDGTLILRIYVREVELQQRHVRHPLYRPSAASSCAGT